jgi:hypothetical protein
MERGLISAKVDVREFKSSRVQEFKSGSGAGREEMRYFRYRYRKPCACPSFWNECALKILPELGTGYISEQLAHWPL